mmetsp:Transcript_51309/g.127755  ORF Transcript_51309/g.127755 Transcript_51309/m.127755 type:complete len:251 (+) Transcript_51309:132-884(+)
MGTPSRRTVMVTVSPGLWFSRASNKSASSSTLDPSTPTMMSPSAIPSTSLVVPCIPAIAAGDPGGTDSTSTPSGRWRRRACLPSRKVMPRTGQTMTPNLISLSAMLLIVWTGIANPTPALIPDVENMAVFMPIMRPLLSRRGPPELPGLTAASVWIRFRIVLPVVASMLLPKPDITPLVRVWSRPKGFPIASADCPTSTPLELPSRIGFRGVCAASILSTAMSLSGSMPCGEPCGVDLGDPVAADDGDLH